ncbi:STAS domain-containing protein [Blastococcus sp. TF02A-26]|uniref:STAS domain-containing protein n=1 Tax=Blastococcus sp. TF02A-26 TaxID=2250577 RepID=UPI0013143E17|nr:STAS domain-containing protein [Blastococcus sp. TF02A-26]
MSQLPPFSLDPAGSLEVSVDVTAALITLSGELDSCSAPRIAAIAPALVARGHPDWWLDAEALTFCDGDGLAALLDLREMAARSGATVHLVGASHCVRRLVALVGLTDVLAVEPGRLRIRPLSERLRHPAGHRARPPLPA